MISETKGKAGLIIARGIMNEGQQTDSSLAEMFLENPQAYMAKLKSIMVKAEEEGVDILLLPACAVVWQKVGQLKDYQYAARKIMWVVTGQVNIPSTARVKEKPEHTVVWFHGEWRNYIEPDTTHWLLCGKGFVVVALRSKEKRITVDVISMELRHYAPQPMKTLMTAIKNGVYHRRIISVIQLFRNSENAGIVNGRLTKQLNNECGFQRHVISNEMGNAADCLDIFRFKDFKVD